MATYYVAPGGSNAANGTSLATAWQTIAYAVGATSPVIGGDFIYVKSGAPYTQYVVIGKAGVPGGPITLDTYPGDFPAKAQITTGGVLGGIYNAGFGNWTFRNLEIFNTSGGAAFYFDDAPGTPANSQILIEYCHIHDNNSGDNASGIYIQRQRGTYIVQNNVIHDNLIVPPGPTSGYNATAIVVFGHINAGAPGNCTVWIYHNEIYNQSVGIKFKHPYAPDQNVDVKVAYNFVHDVTGRADIELAATSNLYNPTNKSKRVHHNLIVNHPTGYALKSGADFGDWDTTWDHNTVYNCEGGIAMHREDANQHSNQNLVFDNIFMPRAIAPPPTGIGTWLEEPNAPYSTFDYNHYWNVSNTVTSPANIAGVGSMNMATWRASTNLPDTHAGQANPLFVNNTSDWHLQAGSPCRNTDSGGNDKGCYELRNEIMGPLTQVNPNPPVVTTPPASGLSVGVAASLVQNKVYSLPARVVLVTSTTSVETSMDGVTWSVLANATTTGARTGAVFIRSPNATCILNMGYRK